MIVSVSSLHRYTPGEFDAMLRAGVFDNPQSVYLGEDGLLYDRHPTDPTQQSDPSSDPAATGRLAVVAEAPLRHYVSQCHQNSGGA